MCKKRKYKTDSAAKKELKRLRHKGCNSTYFCATCDAWHLTKGREHGEKGSCGKIEISSEKAARRALIKNINENTKTRITAYYLCDKCRRDTYHLTSQPHRDDCKCDSCKFIRLQIVRGAI